MIRLLIIFTEGKWYPNTSRWIVWRNPTRNVACRRLRPRKGKRHQVHPNRNREATKSMNSELLTARSDTDLLVSDAQTSNQPELRQQPAWAEKTGQARHLVETNSNCKTDIKKLDHDNRITIKGSKNCFWKKMWKCSMMSSSNLCFTNNLNRC